jgi:hypothetical protein
LLPLAHEYQTESPQRLVVIDLMHRPGGRERERLYRALDHFDRDEVDEAILELENAGVLVATGSRLRPSPALICLERLGVLAI